MDVFHFVPDRLGNLDRVRAGLLEEDQAQRRLAVDADVVPDVFVGVLHFGDIAHIDRHAAPRGQRDIQNLVDRVELAAGAQQHVEAAFSDRPDGAVHVFLADRVHDLRDGEIQGAQLFEVQIDVNFAAQTAADAHLAHALDAFEPVQNRFLDE